VAIEGQDVDQFHRWRVYGSTVRIPLFAALATCLVVQTVSAQIIWDPAVFVPAAPTEYSIIEARFDVRGGCQDKFTTTVTGIFVRTGVVQTDCVIGPPPAKTSTVTTFGPLPAGSYTYEVYVDDGAGPVLHSAQPLVVAAVVPAAPTLSPSSLAVLALLLTGKAVLLLRRVS
jgi:hypothetical protein